MPDSSNEEATQALAALTAGDTGAAARLLPSVYDKLRSLAGRYLRKESGHPTLQPTELVHEAYIRLVDINRMDWRGKTHFFAMAATQMRRILVDHARAAKARKRGRGYTRVTLREQDFASSRDRAVEILDLDEALRRLSERSPRQGRVAELRLFAGLLLEEIAHVLAVSERTARQDWTMGRAWLSRELKRGSGGS